MAFLSSKCLISFWRVNILLGHKQKIFQKKLGKITSLYCSVPCFPAFSKHLYLDHMFMEKVLKAKDNNDLFKFRNDPVSLSTLDKLKYMVNLMFHSFLFHPRELIFFWDINKKEISFVKKLGKSTNFSVV